MKTIMLFPGYGSQYVGMIKELYDHSRTIQEYFEEASNCLNLNIVKLAFASSDQELSSMSVAYPIEFVVSCSIAAYLKEVGIHPEVVAGYNNGIFAALHTAGGMSFPDGLYLLTKLSTLYQEYVAVHGDDVGLVKIEGIPYSRLQKIYTNSSLSCALMIDENTYYMSGSHDAIEELKQIVTRIDRASTESAPLEIGLHSPLLEATQQLFNMYLEKVDFKDLWCSVIHPTTGNKVTSAADVREIVAASLVESYHWDKTVQSCAAYDLIVQVAPGNQVAESVKAVYPDHTVYAVNKLADVELLSQKISSFTQE